MSAENEIKHRPVQEIVEFRRNGNFCPLFFSLPEEKYEISLKNPPFRCSLMLSKSTTFFSALWQVVKSVLISLVRKGDRHWKASKMLPKKQPLKKLICNNMNAILPAEGCILVELSLQGKSLNVSGNSSVVWLSCDVFLFTPSSHLEKNFLTTLSTATVVYE